MYVVNGEQSWYIEQRGGAISAVFREESGAVSHLRGGGYQEVAAQSEECTECHWGGALLERRRCIDVFYCYPLRLIRSVILIIYRPLSYRNIFVAHSVTLYAYICVTVFVKIHFPDFYCNLCSWLLPIFVLLCLRHYTPKQTW